MQPGGGGSEMELNCDGVSNSQLSDNYRFLGIFTARLREVFKSAFASDTCSQSIEAFILSTTLKKCEKQNMAV